MPSMPNSVRIELLPLGRTLSVARGTPLQDVLFAQGVEFPCGGRDAAKAAHQSARRLVAADRRRERLLAQPKSRWLAAGRRGQANGDPKSNSRSGGAILADDSVFAFTPQEGLGVAVDLAPRRLPRNCSTCARGMSGCRTGLNVQASMAPTS
jgi:hypothetical protein